ncbi:MAG: hypothetical protein R2879_19615 [Saprospiraceae bacterium]
MKKDIPKIQTFDDLPYPFEVKKVDLGDDVTVAYFDEGKGNNISILIHGLGSMHRLGKRTFLHLQKTTG